MGNKVIVITQARYGSSRLPGKILLKIGGKSLLQIHLERLVQATVVDKVLVATTEEPESAEIASIAKGLNLEVYHGSLNDVLDRFYKAALSSDPDYVVRVTSDCPIIDSTIIDLCVNEIIGTDLDYVSNINKPTYPDGMDVEVFTFKALKRAWEEAKLSSDREHVTPFIRRNSDMNGGTLFKAVDVHYQNDLSDIRLTVDEPKDLLVITHLIEKLGTQLDWKDYVIHLLRNPEITSLNQGIVRNEGYLKSLKKDGNE